MLVPTVINCHLSLVNCFQLRPEADGSGGGHGVEADQVGGARGVNALHSAGTEDGVADPRADGQGRGRPVFGQITLQGFDIGSGLRDQAVPARLRQL